METQVSEEELTDLFAEYVEHPAHFIEDAMGATPWRLQKEIIDSVFKNPVTAVKSCNASGKSYISARIALAYLILKPGSIVITTAPTWRQVKDVLWREIKTALSQSPVKLTNAQATQVGLDIDADWFAVGLSTKDSEKFFGYHAEDILVIVDEASGVEEDVYVGVDAVTPNVNARVLMIGNPTNPDGRFYKVFDDPLVKKFTISAFDTPNFTANGIRDIQDLEKIFDAHPDDDPLEHYNKMRDTLKTPYPALISPANAYRRLLEWGPEHPMFEALIMGNFPSQSSLALIPLGLIMKSVEVWKQINMEKQAKMYAKNPEWNIDRTGDLEMGLDVARFGDDKTVLIKRRGGYVEKPISWAKLDTSITTDRVMDILSAHDWKASIKIDDIGVGGGVTDQLLQRKRERRERVFKVVPLNFSSKTSNPERWFNLRSESYDKLADLFKNRAIAIPDDEELIAELATIRKEYVGKDNNVVKIEAKEKIKERLRRSPDKADALVLAMVGGGYQAWDEPTELPREDGFATDLTPVTGGIGDY